ncbi:hypothetical protein L1887_55787 [Cichorium endivia]|nr:hypothetical protein L1887_55787 [Cichorium endivia]
MTHATDQWSRKVSASDSARRWVRLVVVRRLCSTLAQVRCIASCQTRPGPCRTSVRQARWQESKAIGRRMGCCWRRSKASGPSADHTQVEPRDRAVMRGRGAYCKVRRWTRAAAEGLARLRQGSLGKTRSVVGNAQLPAGLELFGVWLAAASVCIAIGPLRRAACTACDSRRARACL